MSATSYEINYEQPWELFYPPKFYQKKVNCEEFYTRMTPHHVHKLY